MYCTKCGKKAAPGDVYCSGCGKKLRSEQEAQGGKKLLLRIGTLVLAAAIVTVGAATLLRSRPGAGEAEQKSAAVTKPAETERAVTDEPSAETQATVQTPAQPAAPSQQESYLSREEVEEYGAKLVTLYRYDGEGRVTWKQSPDGYTHHYSYRSDGTLEKEGLALGEEPTGVILYDRHGNPERESDLLGNAITWNNSYDARNRLLSSEKYGPEGILEKSMYTYHSDGGYTLTFSDYADGVLHCQKTTTYDAAGRILSLYQNLDSGMALTVSTENTYDHFGNPQRTEYVYDDGGSRIHEITEYVNTCAADGQLEKAEKYITGNQSPRALERTVYYTYDDDRRLVCQETRGADGDWTYTVTWEYDEAGNLIRSTEDDGGILRTYEYLPLEQLLSP